MNLDREQIGAFLDCLASGRELRPADPAAGWQLEELLSLSGACLATVMLSLAQASKGDVRGQHPEHAEAVSAELRDLAQWAGQYHTALAFARAVDIPDGGSEEVIVLTLDDEGRGVSQPG